jgi:hypothetical protein
MKGGLFKVWNTLFVPQLKAMTRLLGVSGIHSQNMQVVGLLNETFRGLGCRRVRPTLLQIMPIWKIWDCMPWGVPS